LTVTVGNSNVGVAVIVGDNTIVGVNLAVGVNTPVGVRVKVAIGASVEGSTVAVMVVLVGVARSSVEGAQAETNRKISQKILYTLI
jgi:hypothetical protein